MKGERTMRMEKDPFDTGYRPLMRILTMERREMVRLKMAIDRMDVEAIQKERENIDYIIEMVIQRVKWDKEKMEKDTKKQQE